MVNIDVSSLQEEIAVIFHASSLGRSDIIKSAITEIKTKFKDYSQTEISSILSVKRAEDDITPLHIASFRGHADVIRLLLNCGADPSVTPEIGDYEGKLAYEVAYGTSKQVFDTYFFEQIAMGNIFVVEKLLKGGVPVDIKDGSKANDDPLHWACSFNNILIAQLLISHGSRVNNQNNDGQTGLHIACKNTNYDMVQLLLSEGASTTVADIKGYLPLDLVSHSSQNDLDKVQSIIQLLQHPPVPIMLYTNQYISNNSKQKQQELKTLNDNIIKDSNHDFSTLSIHNNGDAHHYHDIFHDDNTNELSQPGTDYFHENRSLINNSNRNNHNDDEMSSYIQDDAVDMNDMVSNESLRKDNPQLVMWPPSKVQIFQSILHPLILSSTAVIFIYLSPVSYQYMMINSETNHNETINLHQNEIYHDILIKSEIIDTFQQFGFTVELSTTIETSKILLYINPLLCPTRQSFRLSIEQDYIKIIAADTSGLLYALYSLVQLLQLHSEIIIQDSVTNVYIPPIIVKDSPDFQQRAVLWSYRKHAQLKYTILKDYFHMFSKARVNMLLLVLDPLDLQLSESTDNSLNPSLLELVELCNRVCIDVVPTFIIFSPSDTIDISIKHLNHNRMISVCLEYDLVHIEEYLARLDSEGSQSTNTTHSMDKISLEMKIQSCCKESCIGIFQDVLNSGYHSILLTCNLWTLHHISPFMIATKLGLNVIERSMDEIFPTSLYLKPILNVGSFVTKIQEYIATQKRADSTIVVLPLFMDIDYLTPTIILKYACFIYGGLSWNGIAVYDMLSVGSQSTITNTISLMKSELNSHSNKSHPNKLSSSRDISDGLYSKEVYSKVYSASILREVTSLILFNQRSAILKDPLSTILSILTGEWYFQHILPSQISQETSQGSQQIDAIVTPTKTDEINISSVASDITPSVIHHLYEQHCVEVTETEQFLVSLLTCSNQDFSYSSIATKPNLSEYLKQLRRSIAVSKWKRVSTISKSFLENFTGISLSLNNNRSKGNHVSPEIESTIHEYFSMIHQLTIVCRGLILSYNSITKHTTKDKEYELLEGIKLRKLVTYMPPGVKSDVANQILEAMEHLSIHLKGKFERLSFHNSRHYKWIGSDEDNLSTSTKAEKNGALPMPLPPEITMSKIFPNT